MTKGPPLPYGTTIFCDDIRSEEGGKRSLMGVYTGEMTFSDNAPAMLPVFCAQLNVALDQANLPKSLGFRLFKDTEKNRELMLSVDVNLAEVPSPPRIEPDAQDPDAPAVALFSFEARFTSVVFEENCKLRSRVFIDGEELRIGALSVRLSS